MKTRQKIRQALIIISFLLFPITIFYFSPYLIVVGSFEGVIVGSFVVFTAMFIASLFFGRLFCGWACPGAGLQEALFNARDKKISQKYNWVKFAIWLPWVILIIYATFQAGGYRKTDLFFHTTNGISVGAPWAYIIYYTIVGLFVVTALVIGKRSFCHHICWMAPFMIIGRKIGLSLHLPSLRLEADDAKCTNCSLCTKNCPMSLEVNGMVKEKNMNHSECILCGTCVDVCARGAIKYRFK